MPTVQDWLRQHNLLNLSGRDMASPLTVGEEQAVVDPALRALRPGYTGGDMNTAGKYQMILQYLNQLLPPSFNTPIPRADVVRAGNEWGYIGALPGDDPGPAHGLRIPGVGPGRDDRYLQSLLAQMSPRQPLPAAPPMPPPLPAPRQTSPPPMPAAQPHPQSITRSAQAPSTPPMQSSPASPPMQEAVSLLARAPRRARPSGIKFF